MKDVQKVAVVTGAARGIGQVVCEHLARAGVAIAGVDLADMAETESRVSREGAPWADFRGDVSQEVSANEIGRAVLSRFGRCDILVNCAGIWPPKTFLDLEFQEWKRVLAVNLDSQFLMSKAFVPSMKERGWGRIINFTSSSVLFPIPEYVAYKASKMGAIGLTRGMSTDLGPFGITVNAVSPTLTPTPGMSENSGEGLSNILDQIVQMQAIKRTSDPNDVAALVAFLASDAAGFITGQTMLADGGLSFL